MPRPPGNVARAVKIENETDGTEHHPPGETLTQKYGAGCIESSPLLLTEGGTAQAVTGVEGTIYEFPDCPEQCYAPHPSALTGCHLLPREKALACANHQSLPPLIRPLCGHLPPGEGYFRIAGRFSGRQRSHPLRHLRCHLPLHRGGYFSKNSTPYFER